METRRVLTVSNFARYVGFSHANERGFKQHLKELIELGAIQIQQSGFLGDSMHHHKLVVVKDFTAIENHFHLVIMKQTEDKRVFCVKKKSVSSQINLLRTVWIGRKIGVNVLMRASAKGGSGVYLYIPRDYADAYGIDSGDKVEAKLIRTFKEKEIEEKTTDTVDISQTKKTKR